MNAKRYYADPDNLWDAPPDEDGWSDTEPSIELVDAADYDRLRIERDVARTECARLNTLISDYIASAKAILDKHA